MELNSLKIKNNLDIKIKAQYILIILITISGIIYYPALKGGFILDDNTYFHANDILEGRSLIDVFSFFSESSNYWGELLPVRDYIYGVEWYLFGENPVGYHVVSIILYMIAACVLYKFSMILFSFFLKPKFGIELKNTITIGAILLTLLFLVHPIYVECIAFISGQKDILSVVFVLGSLYYLFKVGITNTKKYFTFLIIGSVLHYLAILSKLSALSTIFFVPVLWWITWKGSMTSLMKRLIFWTVFNLPVIYWYYHMNSVTKQFITENLLNTPFIERIPRAFNIIGIHFQRIIYPWPLSFGYPYSGKFELDLNFSIGLIVVLVTFLILIYYRRSLFALGASMFLLYLLPVLQIFPEMMNVHIYDRYLAIPLIGIFIVFVGFYFSICRISSKLNYIFLGVTTIIVLLYASITSRYIPKFKSDVAISENVYSLYPDFLKGAYMYAVSLIKEGNLTKAEEVVSQDKIFNSPIWLRELLLGRIYLRAGLSEHAYNLLNRASQKAKMLGDYPQANYYMAEILVKNKNYDLARILLHELLNHNSKDPLLLFKSYKLLKKINSLRDEK